MANSIPPLPIKIPIADRTGMISMQWISYFQEFFKRVGGSSAPSFDSLIANTAANTTAITTIGTQITTINSEINDLGQGRHL